MTSNQLTYFRDLETKRHNIAMEQENARHDYESEVIGYRQAAASQTAAYASYLQAENAQRMYELQRQLAPYEIALKQAQTRQQQKQVDYLTAQTTYMGAQTEYSRAQTDYSRSQTAYTEERTRTQQIATRQAQREYNVYSTYGMDQAKWNLYHTVMQTVTGYVSTAGRFASDAVKAITGVIALA